MKAEGKPVNDKSYATAVMRFACEFSRDTGHNEFPANPVGNAVVIASELWAKYKPQPARMVEE